MTNKQNMYPIGKTNVDLLCAQGQGVPNLELGSRRDMDTDSQV